MLLSRSEAVESGSREVSGPGVSMVDSTFVELTAYLIDFRAWLSLRVLFFPL